ncbi:uncharacterized protein [Hetaerina americana]|uniref:uncharacterized protein n=1 Tax=Hetaerina americana TaxID=62018 RepID=UPI003A7F1D27
MDCNNKLRCRLCRKKCAEYIDIFDPKGTNNLLVWKVIKEITEVDVSLGDGLPPTICPQCMEKVTSFKRFKTECISSRIEFLKEVANEGIVVSPQGDSLIDFPCLGGLSGNIGVLSFARQQTAIPEDTSDSDVDVKPVLHNGVIVDPQNTLPGRPGLSPRRTEVIDSPELVSSGIQIINSRQTKRVVPKQCREHTEYQGNLANEENKTDSVDSDGFPHVSRVRNRGSNDGKCRRSRGIGYTDVPCRNFGIKREIVGSERGPNSVLKGLCVGLNGMYQTAVIKDCSVVLDDIFQGRGGGCGYRESESRKPGVYCVDGNVFRGKGKGNGVVLQGKWQTDDRTKQLAFSADYKETSFTSVAVEPGGSAERGFMKVGKVENGHSSKRLYGTKGTARKGHSCKVCGLCFQSHYAKQLHLIAEHYQQDWMNTCTVCGMKFPYQYLLDRHMRRQHRKNLPLKCKKCSCCFSQKRYLLMHLDKFH